MDHGLWMDIVSLQSPDVSAFIKLRLSVFLPVVSWHMLVERMVPAKSSRAIIHITFHHKIWFVAMNCKIVAHQSFKSGSDEQTANKTFPRRKRLNFVNFLCKFARKLSAKVVHCGKKQASVPGLLERISHHHMHILQRSLSVFGCCFFKFSINFQIYIAIKTHGYWKESLFDAINNESNEIGDILRGNLN